VRDRAAAAARHEGSSLTGDKHPQSHCPHEATRSVHRSLHEDRVHFSCSVAVVRMTSVLGPPFPSRSLLSDNKIYDTHMKLKES
jgi:hypothetical protein